MKSKMMSLKNLDGENGKFSGYLSTYGNADRDGDIIVKGAFDEGVANKSTVPLLFNHSTYNVVGKLDLSVDAKGLYVEGVLDLDSEEAQKVYRLMKMGALDSMSVGMIIKEYLPIDPEKPYGAWEIKKAQAVEGSIVAIPANDRATIDYVKNLSEKSRSVENMDLENKEPKKSFVSKIFDMLKSGEEKTDDEARDTVIIELTKKAEDLENELNKSNEKVEALETRITEIEAKEKQLSEQEAGLKAQAEKLESEECDKQKQIDDAKAEKDTLIAKFGDLSKEAIKKASEEEKKKDKSLNLFDYDPYSEDDGGTE